MSGCLKKDRIEGEVKDVFGNVLADVLVQVEKSTFTAKTDKNGRYSIDYAPGTFNVVYSKAGFTTMKLNLSIQQKSHFPAQAMMLYPIPSEEGIYYISPTELIKLQPANIIKEDTPGSLFKPGIIEFYSEFSSRPFTIGPGQARFIDTIKHPVRFARLNENNLIYKGNYHLGGIGHDDIYSAIIEDTGEKIGEEKLLVRTVSLEKGKYAWVDILKRETFGDNKGFLPDPKGKAYPFSVIQDLAQESVKAVKEQTPSGYKATVAATQEAGKAGETKTFTVNGVSFKMVRIPAGEFIMGSPPNEPDRNNDETQHLVRISQDFWLGQTEVTQGLWKKVMGNNPSYFNSCGDECPLENVTWNDCQEFIRKLNGMVSVGNFRLPTEAEWEYACRAGTTGPYAGDLDAMGWYPDNSGNRHIDALGIWNGLEDERRSLEKLFDNDCRTHLVGGKKPNAWGLYDMHGNVFEWCQDWYGDYPSGAVTDPAGPSGGSNRVLRGGTWCHGAKFCRSAYRYSIPPGGRGGDPGLRLASSN